VTETSTNPSASTGAMAPTRSIVVSLPKHQIDILENGSVVRTIMDFSTGRAGHLTPLIPNGKLDPTRRERMHYSTLYKDNPAKVRLCPMRSFSRVAPAVRFMPATRIPSRTAAFT
jgi:hypothetical protein